MSTDNKDNIDEFDDFDNFEDLDDTLDPATETDTDDGDWDQYDDSNDTGFADDPAEEQTDRGVVQKKKSGLFNIILIAATVVLGGGFMYMQLGGGATQPQPDQQSLMAADLAVIEEAQETAQRAGSDVPRAPEALQSPAGIPAASEDLPMPTPIQAQTPPPALVQPAPEPLSDGDSQGDEMRLPTAADIMVRPPAATSNQTDTGDLGTQQPTEMSATAVNADETLQDTMAQPAMPAVSDIVTTSPSPMDAEEKALLEKLEKGIDSLGMRLDTMESRIDALAGTVAESATRASDQGTSATDSAQIEALKEAVTALDEKVSALVSDQERLRGNLTAREDAKTPTAPERAASTPVPARMPEVPAPRPQILGRDMPVEDAPPAAPAKAAAPAWVLKGAQPGRATLARRGESDLHPVAVGDAVPGLGRVRAVEYRDGKWVVETTNGTISQ